MVACTLGWAVEPQDPRDPYEIFNRHAYALNKKIDKVFLKTLATVYRSVLPWPVRKGFSNFFANLRDLPTFANEVLQGQFYDAYSDAWRVAINTTVGVVGFVDVASMAGLPKHKLDFGLTLARWGYVDSHYLVLPLFGPHTVRDALALPVDVMCSVYPWIDGKGWRYGLFLGNAIVERAALLDVENVVHEAALDEYTFVRDAYLQRRDRFIRGGKR